MTLCLSLRLRSRICFALFFLQPRFCASYLSDAQSVSARSPEGCRDSDGDEANLEVGAEMRQHHIPKDRILTETEVPPVQKHHGAKKYLTWCILGRPDLNLFEAQYFLALLGHN